MSNRPPIYTGLCIGGPLAGQMLTHLEPHYWVVRYPRISALVPSDSAALISPIEREIYRFDRAFLTFEDGDRRGAWVHQSFAEGAAALRFVLDFYSAYAAQHPSLPTGD